MLFFQTAETIVLEFPKDLAFPQSEHTFKGKYLNLPSLLFVNNKDKVW